nr:hypothetical protein [Pedobacter sp. ASV2]
MKASHYSTNKPLNKYYNFKKLISKSLLYAVLLLLLSINAHAQYEDPSVFNLKPYTPRLSTKVPNEFLGKSSYNLRGDFLIIGNSNLTGTATTESFIKLPTDPTSILNSSSADLQLPVGINYACSRIIYAGLYWFGHRSYDFENEFTTAPSRLLNKQKVKFKAPGMANYIELSAADDDIYLGKTVPRPADFTGSTVDKFIAYYDVTDYVRAAGTGTYAVADIATLGQRGKYMSSGWAGWGMVIVFENKDYRVKNITVLDGFQYIVTGLTLSTRDIKYNLSGFHTPATGNVDMKLGFVASSLPTPLSGGSCNLFIMKPDNTEGQLTYQGAVDNQFFNSTISTEGTPRSPNNVSNFGVNLISFNVLNPNNSLISNNQTTVTLKNRIYGSLLLHSIVISVDSYAPEIQPLISPLGGLSNNTAVVPNQELEFQVDLRNKGNENVTAGKLEISLPKNVYFVSAQPVLRGVSGTWSSVDGTNPLTTAGGKITWDLGNIPLNTDLEAILASLKFKVRVTDDCNMLSADCNKNINITGKMSATGTISTSSASWDLITGYKTVGCIGTPIRDAFVLNISPGDNCKDFSADGAKIFKVCGQATLAKAVVIAAYPAGTKFYSQLPNTTGFDSKLVIGDFTVDQSGAATKYYGVSTTLPDGCFYKMQTQPGGCYMMSNPMIPAKFKKP